MSLSFLALTLASSLLAQNSPTQQLAPATHSALEQLTGYMLLHGQAYEYDRQLSDGIGPRLTGSSNYEKAANWAVAEFTHLGLTNVHKEPWTIPATWEQESTGPARILTPHPQRLHLESEGWSPSTPAGGIRGPVFHLPSENDTASIRANAEKIKGSIVLIDADSRHAGPPDTPEGVVADNDKLIAQLGALAILTTGTTQNAVSVGGSVWDGHLLDLPTANIGLEDSQLLRRLLDQEEAQPSGSTPVTIEFSFKNRIRENVQVDNVIADIPGRSKPNEWLLLGAHLDSWHPGTGAQDDGTGVASLLAIAQAVISLHRPPARTLRFALFGGEEEGLLGSLAYAKAHAADLPNCDAVLITDTGAEPPKGWLTFGRAEARQSLGPVASLLAGLGANSISDDGRFTFGVDAGSFIARGVPSLLLWTSSDQYRTLHHKPSDTFDKVNERDLELGAATVGLTAYALADSPQPLAPHLNPTQVEEQMKQLKIFYDFDDMRHR
ncbi:MAG TPA: M20/M25/M40 family metallo-hydrolase, partial [Acidobacteriaceae bacterium]|nr:M20/M25/M40 family metallo-hydrolase [Acidobacteriaceae bacterium]